MKKLVCAALACALLTGGAGAAPEMSTLKSPAGALYDASGQMLYESNADTPLQPASVTKIMTMLLVMEAVDSGKASLDEMVTGSAYAASMGGTQIWLKEGEQLTLDEMLKAIAVGSANDCAVAVAEHLAGSEAAFVEQMNARAAELGCTGTTFVNANGLDHGEAKTVTTAHDLALISVELLRHPKILEYTSIWMDTIRDGAFSLANTNKMLRSYQGMVGLKTGYMSEAGYSIAAAAERDGMMLVAVVMASKTKEDRMADTAALLNYGFANFARWTPEGLDDLPPLPVQMGRQEYVEVETPACDGLTVEKTKIEQLETRIELPETVEAPVAAGQQVGQVVVTDGENALLTLPITAAGEVARQNFADLYGRMLRVLLMKEAA